MSNKKTKRQVPPITELPDQLDTKADENVKGGGTAKLPATGSPPGVPIPYPNIQKL